MRHIEVPEHYDAVRLDRFLKKIYPTLKQGEIEKWCRKGLIKQAGSAVKQAKLRVQSGQVFLIPSYEEDPSAIPQKPHISAADRKYVRSLIIAEHADFWVLAKPSGLAVQGGTNISRSLDTFLPALKDSEAHHPKIVHRLDKDTSGVLLVAKNDQAARFLAKCFRERLIKKTYHAVVIGPPHPTRGLVDLPIAKGKGSIVEKMVVDLENGLPAQTYYQVEAELGRGLHLLCLQPVTGRTHQLRVHCAYLESPILGDGKYGGSKAHPFLSRTRLMLHASSVELCDREGKQQKYVCHFRPYFGDVADLQ